MLPLVHHPHYRAELRENHPLPINKFGLLAELLQSEGLVGPEGFHTPVPLSGEELKRVHDPDYVDAVLEFRLPREQERRIGLPLTPEVVRRAQAVCAGTVLAGRLALEHGVACNTAGGSHHAARAEGSGYCIFNDVALAAEAVLRSGEARRILVVDLDVHQGDGTALIFSGDPRVFTFSMHAAKNFPVRKAVSDCDVALGDGLGDEAYLLELRRVLPGVLEQVRPELVFYVAGVDPHADDRLGRLQLSDAGLFERDLFVIDSARTAGACVAGVLGGGYDRDVPRLARRHAILHRAAAAVARTRTSAATRSLHSASLPG